MAKPHQLLIIFVPAIILVLITLFVRVIQYQSLYQTDQEIVENNGDLPIPIFPDDAVIGNKRAPKTLIAFEDLGCASCAVQNELFDQLVEKHPKQVKIIWKGLPVTRFPVASDQAHAYAYCAAQQNMFIPFKQLVYANNRNLTPSVVEQMAVDAGLDIAKIESCIATGAPAQYAENTRTLASILQIQSVPTVFYNGEQVEEPTTLAGWERLLGLTQ